MEENTSNKACHHGSRYYAGTLSLIQLIIAPNLKVRHSCKFHPRMPGL